MKYIFRLLFFLIFFTGFLTVQGQNRKDKKEQKSHLSKYETQTLTDSLLPVLMPYNRWIDPAGEQLYFGDKELENHALDCALSPDGRWIAVEGRYSIVIISAENRQIVNRTPLRKLLNESRSMNTFSGIQWHNTGSESYLFWSISESAGTSFVVKAKWNGSDLILANKFEFIAEKPAMTALPNEVLLTDEDGNTFLYTVLNGTNKLVKRNAETGETIWTVETGVAPFGITIANGKIYVTNWAGSVPEENDKNVAGIPWGSAKVDPNTGATREGTVSLFNPADGKLIGEIKVGLHPNDIISSPDGNFVYIANANSDAISVIDTKTDLVSENIPVRLAEEKNKYFGDSPNGLGISGDGKTLYVANGMDNAVALVNLGKNASSFSETEKSKIAGFIPTGAYPGAVCVYNNEYLFVANIEAQGARIPSTGSNGSTVSYNSHKQMASVSVIPVPDNKQLEKYTHHVKETNQLFRIALAEKMPRENVVPVPVPLHIGEPSVFKHVLYIIKENRTYDQVLGDHPKGDGDPSLCIFGNDVTPNTHKICDDFLLLDNFYASGKCSAEGHQWTDMAFVNDYIEKNVRSWYRSYPHVQEDAMVYAPTGFIWDNARMHGKSVRIYGEACVPEFDNNETWESIYNKFQEGKIFEFTNTTTIEPVKNILSQNFPGYDGHKIPDVLRAKTFIDELKQYEKMDGDQWPELMVMALPNDHTGGTRPGLPTPRAMVADNDLALGQIVEAVSKSRFWDTTVIFVVEDDSQAGWDHVSAYRTVALVISPYTKFDKTNHTNYNQVSMVRTIEQILGLPPMNIMDATAMPMFDCFNTKADHTPFISVPNLIQLNEMNKEVSQLNGKELHFAKKSMLPQFDRIDAGDDDLFNRIIWFAAKGKKPYPARYSGKEVDDEDD